MAKRLKNHTLDQYLTVLAKKEPTPGGGSAAAMTAAMGAALLAMVTRYSIGKGQSKTVDNKLRRHLTKAEELRRKLTELVDRDAEAYQQVVKARGETAARRRAAERAAAKVPGEVGRLCYQAVQLAPYLVEKGNKYLLSDVEIAVEMLKSAYNSALVLQHHH
ncbi:MAG: cyclodeaminase/cyclohydrolase family protein [Candidatus Omnitrophica bacterium]|nr:cyclodeaminase/cyclohydrolase family protein [Candidatus Omnitrophota bacterium]MCB9721319.1 cyclodeaminase/cyclohydrolase family protein [Candidatus Omnitrophota bacterium]